MPARKTPKSPTPRRKHKSAAQVRSLVDETRRTSDELVAAGIDRKRLDKRLTEIERHLVAEHRDPAELHSLLSELQADLIAIENRLIGSGVLQMLHQILGTGVPSPR